jgi:predicted amidohydrolase
VKVAAIQCPSRFGDVAGNRERLSALVRRAAGDGARIIVLPETAVTGYLSQDLRRVWHVEGYPLDSAFEGVDPRTAAESVPGPSTRHFAALAKELSIYLTIPLLEAAGEDGDRRYYNTVCLASPAGEVVAHYRKLNPWWYPEQSWATKGDLGVQTFDTEYGRVGLAICYDIHTILDDYRPHEIWALLYPIAWVSDSEPDEWFDEILPGRVERYRHYLVGANWSVEEEQRWCGYGYSLIVGPDGAVLARARSRVGTEIVTATIPTARALAARPKR